MVGLSKGIEIQNKARGFEANLNEITLSCSAVAPVLVARSEPAKSTKLI